MKRAFRIAQLQKTTKLTATSKLIYSIPNTRSKMEVILKTLQSERLIIRNFKIGDAQDLHKMILGYAASPYAIYDHQWPTDYNEIKGVAEWFANGDQFLAVCLKVNGQFIGMVTSNLEITANLGYIFDIDYQGKGYASEACRVIINFGFREKGVQEFVTGTAAENTPSCRMLERLGFKVTEEKMKSFQTDEDGNPIEFKALTFYLSNPS